VGGWASSMEKLGLNVFDNIYQGKRVLLTGHSGFKGSWFALWLHRLGAQVVGVSLAPENDICHWSILKIPIVEKTVDIRDLPSLLQVFNDHQPELVFHLAAQPLVRRSYREPLISWSTNVMGTANVLEACRLTASTKAAVVITTDKCYENYDWPWGYRENDRLGGHDPYSASKAASELVVDSYRRSFFGDSLLVATARAGNVIGGGDWSEDRLIPDLVRAIESNQSLEIRYPNATRPWQHVLESLAGYLLLGQKLLEGNRAYGEAWNFGPVVQSNRSVSEVLNILSIYWNRLRWHVTEHTLLHEANLLYLDSAKANSRLAWKSVWDLDSTIEKTADWYIAWLENRKVISHSQLDEYIAAAEKQQIGWTLE
jgi:CDP-glucose 4,6-dehydratase